ncbi:MAG: hypothetical protein RBQ97_07690 [Acholeplasma sp.]|nr:hypothetical protein [Acholeplasma sp.]
MNIVNKKTIDFESRQVIINDIPVPINNNLLSKNFKTQLLDWRKHLLLAIDDVDNKCVLIFDALFIVELWLKLLLIERLPLLSFNHFIEDCGINLDGRSGFSLDMVRHNIGKTLKALINSNLFVTERNVLTYILERCEFLAQEALLQKIDNYSDLKYNYKNDRQFTYDVKVDMNLKVEIRRLLEYANS